MAKDIVIKNNKIRFKDYSNLYALSSEQTKCLEEGVIKNKENAIKIMQIAGIAVYEEIKKTIKPNKILIICGAGNNGGDGYALASLLYEENWDIDVLSVLRPNTYECKYYAEKYKGKLIKNEDIDITIRKADLIVDAIFGIGLSREIPVDSHAIMTH